MPGLVKRRNNSKNGDTFLSADKILSVVNF